MCLKIKILGQATGLTMAIIGNLTMPFCAKAQDDAAQSAEDLNNPRTCFCFRPKVGIFELELRKGCHKGDRWFAIWCCTDTDKGKALPYERIFPSWHQN